MEQHLQGDIKMKYTKRYDRYGQLEACVAENGKVIECEYREGGLTMKKTPYWYYTLYRGEKTAYRTLREAKQVLETGKDDLDLLQASWNK